jgi:hypothetical protein
MEKTSEFSNREELIEAILAAKTTRNVEIRDEEGKCTGLRATPCTLGERIKEIVEERFA